MTIDYAAMTDDLRAYADDLEQRATAARAAATALAEPELAPYGYKADGTPRKRAPLAPEAQARAAATRAERWTLKADKPRAGA